MTTTEKILSKHSSQQAKAGDLIQCRLDWVLGNDITAPVAIDEFEKMSAKRVFDEKRIILVPDHFTPNKDIASAQMNQKMRHFAQQMHIEHYYELGEMGIEHVLIPEKGLAAPGEVIIGADSHTCTYGALGAFSTGVGSTDMAAGMATGMAWFKVPHTIGVHLTGRLQPHVSGKDIILYLIGIIGVDGARYHTLEFFGSGLEQISIDSRLTMANMVVEAGAKNGIFPVDEVTQRYLEGRVQRTYEAFATDSPGDYLHIVELDLSCIPLTVAMPHSPGNTRPAAEVVGLGIHQAVIGSCTNGRIEDLRNAAMILKGKRVHPQVRCLVIPGSPSVMRQALQEGLLEIFLDAKAVVTMPTCGPCLGGHCGILADGERAVSTTNRNFIGRMGHAQSEVILASPAIAAASAVAGCIALP